jgi:hypothetical protein
MPVVIFRRIENAFPPVHLGHAIGERAADVYSDNDRHGCSPLFDCL